MPDLSAVAVAVAVAVVAVTGAASTSGGRPLLTVGHGTLTADDFSALLTSAGADQVVDIRSFPGSRRHPQFGREAMGRWVPEAGIAYSWEPRLGGRRRPAPASPNVALRHEAFRGYADHMGSDDFRDGLASVLVLANGASVAVMCSETLWWRCHRRLLADAVVLLRGVAVRHLFHDGSLVDHPPLGEARVVDGRLVYDRGATPPLL